MKFDGLPCFSNQVFLSWSKRYHGRFLSGFVGRRSTAHASYQPKTPVWSSKSWTELRRSVPRKYRLPWQIDNVFTCHAFDTTFIQYATKLLCVEINAFKVHCCKTIDTDCWKRACKLKKLQHLHSGFAELQRYSCCSESRQVWTLPWPRYNRSHFAYLLTNFWDTCMKFKKLNWKTMSAKKISIALAVWQRFHMTCVWHHFYSIYYKNTLCCEINTFQGRIARRKKLLMTEAMPTKNVWLTQWVHDWDLFLGCWL